MGFKYVSRSTQKRSISHTGIGMPCRIEKKSNVIHKMHGANRTASKFTSNLVGRLPDPIGCVECDRLQGQHDRHPLIVRNLGLKERIVIGLSMRPVAMNLLVIVM